MWSSREREECVPRKAWSSERYHSNPSGKSGQNISSRLTSEAELQVLSCVCVWGGVSREHPLQVLGLSRGLKDRFPPQKNKGNNSENGFRIKAQKRWVKF